MTVSLSLRRPAVLAFSMFCCLLLTEHQAIGQKFLGFGDKTVNYKPYKDAAGRFELDIPTKDWNPVPTVGGAAVAIFTRKDGAATLVIELAQLAAPLLPSEIATNAQIEVETLKEKQPQAKDFKSELIDTKAGPASLIRYAGVGSNGPERVLHGSIAVGQDLYRLHAVVLEGSLAKHEAVIVHMIQSFKTAATPATPKA